METAPSRLSPGAYLDHLRSDAARMATLARADGALDVPVPTCPGWTVRDVLVHTGQVYLRKVANMRTMAAAAAAEFGAEPDPEGDVVVWFEQALARLTTELEERGPEAASYTWWPPEQTVGFWFRRMAQETAVHRADVESAAEAMTAVDDDLAADGIDEVLEMFLGGDDLDEAVPDAVGEIVAVRTGDRVWRLALEPTSVSLRRGPGSADATVTGEPSELLLWLWGRRPDSAVHIAGEPAPVAALRKRLVHSTQ